MNEFDVGDLRASCGAAPAVELIGAEVGADDAPAGPAPRDELREGAVPAACVEDTERPARRELLERLRDQLAAQSSRRREQSRPSLERQLSDPSARPAHVALVVCAAGSGAGGSGSGGSGSLLPSAGS